jgi:nucleotide-binding universal stress UspA family protein
MSSLHAPAYGLGSGAPPAPLAGREVVVGFDGTTPAMAAVRWAAVEAGRLGGSLLVLYAADVPTAPSWGLPAPAGRPDLARLSREVAAQGAALARAQDPGLAVHSLGVVGGAAAELVAHSADAGLVVVGRRPRSAVQSAVLGSVSFAVSMHARCPVVVVQQGREHHPEGAGAPIVVGVDGSRAAHGALQLAAQFAWAWTAPIRVVSAWHVPVLEPWSELYGGAADLAEVQRATAVAVSEDVAIAVQALRAEHPDLDVSAEAVEGGAVDVLVRASRDAGLVVVGSRGHGGFAGMMLGSVSHALLRGAHSPVVVVRRGAF